MVKRKISNKKNKQTKKTKIVETRKSDEDIFFSKILAKKDFEKKKIHKSIEKATEVMKNTKLEIQKCPFCKLYTATYNMMQRRSGDEGATAEFKCTNQICARSWRGIS
jgi:DNA-directed RNA polymerase subunit M/transcription elongation factor TFIIS